VVDARSGGTLKTYRFATGDTFVNDVVVTEAAAFFTDSFRPVLYRVPLGRDGRLADTHSEIPLSGDFVHRAGEFNANGIAETPDRRALLISQTNTGQLHRVEPTGVTRVVDLGGDALVGADGLLVEGRTLYVVENAVNTVTVYRLDRTGDAGTRKARITDPRFDVPTTVASFGHRLYLPNARFSTPPTPTTPYSAIAVPKGRG
jgi:sugar lactone lactonase YvrE